MTTAYVLAGLPAGGKSTVSKIGAKITGGERISAGEMIRRMAEEAGLENPSSSELGEFAAERRGSEGTAFFAENVVGMLLREEIDPDYPLWIDSVRHIDSVHEFREYFDTTVLVFVDGGGVQDRLERLRERGRDDEDSYDELDLIKRDHRELEELGTRTIIKSDETDHVIHNTGTLEQLRDAVWAVSGRYE